MWRGGSASRPGQFEIGHIELCSGPRLRNRTHCVRSKLRPVCRATFAGLAPAALNLDIPFPLCHVRHSFVPVRRAELGGKSLEEDIFTPPSPRWWTEKQGQSEE